MPDWDQDSPRLRENLRGILEEIAQNSARRTVPTVEMARSWQVQTMRGLHVPEARFVGAFRGEPGLEAVQVTIGAMLGIDPSKVAVRLGRFELGRFETKLKEIVAAFDTTIPAGGELHTDQLAAILDLCAWVHAEWVRIHPFANGNGRTARLWANFIAMRYGLPPFIRLRPRPDSGYAEAGAEAMQGKWKPTAIVFRHLLNEFLDEYQG